MCHQRECPFESLEPDTCALNERGRLKEEGSQLVVEREEERNMENSVKERKKWIMKRVRERLCLVNERGRKSG